MSLRRRSLVLAALGALPIALSCSPSGFEDGTGSPSSAAGDPGAGGGATSGSGATGNAGGEAETSAAGGAMGGGGPASGSGTGGSSECAGGTADCNGDPADGCETLVTNDPDHCGDCDHACPDGPSAPALCVAGACTLDCPAGTGSCDGDAANGCETDTNDDAHHCGGCGIDCGGAPCISGACACATETQQAETLQLDLFIMLDQSGSMDEPVAVGGTRWNAVTTALDGFFADPTNAGVGVGIQYFPLPPLLPPPLFCGNSADCGLSEPCVFGFCVGGGTSNGSDSCNPADYALAEVAIAPLGPAQANALSSSMDNHAPTTDTPTGPALKGAIHHAKTWATNHPGHVAAVILATDGEPTECAPMDIPSIAALAATGNSGNPSVKTFVIGVGQLLANLNAIAVSGGSGSAYLVDTNANVVQQLSAALKAIQQKALSCEYAIPQPAMGTLDYDKVNVQYTPGGGIPQLIGNVANAGACDPQSGGWYYDNPAAPTKILLCPATCSTVEADDSGQIDILLGCDTIHE